MFDYNICYSLDSQYAEQLAVSMSSILKNADKNDNINFYILDGGLTERDKLNIDLLNNIKQFSIRYIKMNEADFKSCPMLKNKNKKYKDYHVTLPTYFRFKLPSILTEEIDKVLYIDCDVIIRSSLKELFGKNIKDSAALMVLDSESKRESERMNLKKYYNAGVMLINLDYWRKHNVENRLFDYAATNQEKILWQDQDILNAVLQDEIKELQDVWNFQYFQYENIDAEKLSDIKIFHLAGRFKPWLMAFEHPLYDVYYFYLSLTAWKSRIIEYKEKASGKTLKNNIGGSVTNIQVKATQDDVQNIYSEITKNYDYTNNLIHNEITKNYDYTNNLIHNEITKNYDYTNNLIHNEKKALEDETDSKISRVYDEISKNYDYTKELIQNEKDAITGESDVKISKIYDEISKNYDYTNDLSNELKERIVRSETNTDIELNRLKDFFVNDTDEKISKNNNAIDSKISQVYDEISKNYDYTKKLILDETAKNFENTKELIQNERDAVTGESDVKISKVYDEITKNYKYTENLVNELEERTKLFENNTKIESDKTNNELNELKNNTDDEFKTIKTDFTNRTGDVYAYTKNQVTDLFCEINESHKLLNDKIEYKSIENDKKIESSIESVKILNEELKNDTNKAIDNVNEKLYKLEAFYRENIKEMQNSFNEALNAQRIKYEKKLTEMEDIISSFDKKYQPKKKSLFEKFKKKRD